MSQEENTQEITEEKPKGRFDGREIYMYRPIEEGNPPKPEKVHFYMPKRREWSEINMELLLKYGIQANDLPSEAELIKTGIASAVPKRVNMVAIDYGVLATFIVPEDRLLIEDLSPTDVGNVIKAIQPNSIDLTEEHEKNSPSHSGQPKNTLNALSATESKKSSEDVPAPVTNLG